MRSHWSWGRTTSGVVLACGVACGGAYATEPLTDASTGDRHDGGAADGAEAILTPADAGAVDAAPDAATTFCKTKTRFFCDDFDETALGALWSGTRLAFPDSGRIEQGGAVSPPGAFVIETQSDAGAGETVLSRTFASPLKHAVAEADIQIASVPADPTKTVALFELAFAQPGKANWHLRLHHYASKVEVVEAHFGYADGGFNYVFHPSPQAFVVGQWMHVSIEVTARVDLPALGVVTVGGQKIFDGPLQETWLPSTLEVHAGGYALYWGIADWKVKIDNVTVEAD